MPVTTRTKSKYTPTTTVTTLKTSKLDTLPTEIRHLVLSHLLPVLFLAHYHTFADTYNLTFKAMLRRIRVLLQVSQTVASDTIYLLQLMIWKRFELEKLSNNNVNNENGNSESLKAISSITEGYRDFLLDLKERSVRCKYSNREHGRVYEIGWILSYRHDLPRALLLLDKLIDTTPEFCNHNDFKGVYDKEECSCIYGDLPYAESRRIWRKIREGIAGRDRGWDG